MSWVHQWPLSDISGTTKRIILEVLFNYLDISLYRYHYVMQKNKNNQTIYELGNHFHNSILVRNMNLMLR
jgi:hypothetical protein